MKPQPQFLRIRWEVTSDQGAAITLEAILCLRHRQEIALAFASARGARELGEACDLCEGRRSPHRSIRSVAPAARLYVGIGGCGVIPGTAAGGRSRGRAGC